MNPIPSLIAASYIFHSAPLTQHQTLTMMADLLVLTLWITLILMLVQTIRISKPLKFAPTTATEHNSDGDDDRTTTTAAKVIRRRRRRRPVPIPKPMRSRARGVSRYHARNVPLQTTRLRVVLSESKSVKPDARKFRGFEITDEFGVRRGLGGTVEYRTFQDIGD